MKRFTPGALVLAISLSACTFPPAVDSRTARERYLEAKTACVTDHPDSLTRQADCRGRAADAYIRPFYRYGDLMTLLQQKRRALAVKADRHEISRTAYERQVARAERVADQEENRRNRAERTLLTHAAAPVAF